MRYVWLALVVLLTLLAGSHAEAAIGYADSLLAYFDSGAGIMSGPYGGTYPIGPGYPMPVPLSVVLGPEPGPTGYPDFLSLPTGSYVTVGFVDEFVMDGPGNDIFVQEVGGAGERAEVYVSNDLLNFVLLGVAQDDVTTAFDLGTIGFTLPVWAVKVVGLDSLGGSPGFDVMNVQGLPGSVQVVPEPSTLLIWSLLAGLAIMAGWWRRKWAA